MCIGPRELNKRKGVGKMKSILGTAIAYGITAAFVLVTSLQWVV